MSSGVSSRAFALVAGLGILSAIACVRISERGSFDDYTDRVSGVTYGTPEPELPPGQQFFAIPLNGQSPSVKQGNRIDVLYQEEADTTPALISEDVEIHSTYKGCQDPYPSVRLLLAKEEAERLGLLRGDGGTLTIRITQRVAEKE